MASLAMDDGENNSDDVSSQTEMKASIKAEAQAMNNMEGKDEKGDIRVTTFDVAMTTLEEMIPKNNNKYNYESMFLGKGVCAGKDRTDVHRAFLLWCQKSEDRAADSFNVSKAFRRLEGFADYQHRMHDKYFNEMVDIHSEEMQQIKKIMNIDIPEELHVNTGAVKWIMDMETWDLSIMKNANEKFLKGVMNWFWSLMLTSMFDDACCIEGVVIIEAFGNMGISGMMGWQSAFKPIETDLNEMFYGVTPFKMNSCVLVGCPWWLSGLIMFMRLFISKKMSERIKNFNLLKMQEYMGGCDQLPNGCLGGTRLYKERYPGMTRGNDGVVEEVEEEEEEEEDITF